MKNSYNLIIKKQKILHEQKIGIYTFQKKVYELPIAHEKALKALASQEMQSKTMMRYLHIPNRMARINKKDNSK